MVLFVLLLLCALIQLIAAYKEIFTWEAFSDKVLGLPTLLDKREVAAPVREEVMTLTGQMGLNQGVYNLFLAAGILPGLWLAEGSSAWLLVIFMLVCMVIAGVVGALTVPSPDGGNGNLITFGIQAVFPLVALISIFATGVTQTPTG